MIKITKFQEIPKMIRISSYMVHQQWNYFINHWIPDQYDINLDPDFQRAHVWNESQQIDYIEFILKGGITGKSIYFNHPGWFSHFAGELEIVDGKQRIEAVRRFLKNEIVIFGSYYNEFKDRLPLQARFEININDLQTRKEVLQWYLEFNSCGVIHTDEELNKVRVLLDKEKK